MSNPLVFPVGHYLGSNYRGGAYTDLDSHVLRIGWRLHRLERVDQFAVWALAHGLPEGADMEPWTLAATEGAARASGVRDARAILADLMLAGLVVEVDADTDDAVEFAQLCRLHALQNGMGELAEATSPNRYGIGMSANAAAQVDAFTYELWKWGPACDSLWHICEIFARAEMNDGPSDPHDVLRRCLPAVQVLVAHGAAYLDEAREQWDIEPAAEESKSLAD